MNRDNDWFFDKFDHETDKMFKHFTRLWLVGVVLYFLAFVSFIAACVVVVLALV